MKSIKILAHTQALPAGITDTETPVSIYLKLRDKFPNTSLLESSDYHGNRNSRSFICFDVRGGFEVNQNRIKILYADGSKEDREITGSVKVVDELKKFLDSFDIFRLGEDMNNNGIFGYSAYDAVQYFENIKFSSPEPEGYHIPEMRYFFYRYIITFDHFNNRIYLTENLMEGEDRTLDRIKVILNDKKLGAHKFHPSMDEVSNLTDQEYMNMVTHGKSHCFRGDVFQIVLSRRFSQKFKGDEFNVYRALRNINPSPYLFYFDFGGYKIFGSSPEAEIKVEKGKAIINPIAGTFKRTGNDEQDRILADKLCKDEKENAEHVMLVDLARNDLSRNSDHVIVETYREVQYYSHVLHLVSEVSGKLNKGTNPIEVLGNTFPAGTLSGAPKYKAMELIDKYESEARGYYGGAIGFLGFNGDVNHAIMIRSFLCKNNTLYYQAGAGIVSESKEESELNEVNNKLGALKKAIETAKEI
ncbi:anthranilate synthase component I family protein [Saccharicrinis sp. FJH2]|uniref:anthranilate synthase component I family protein n=1 Tax=Saccharicrinis sp. FJH65 TaxID=3344659 RepID=UPI0035F4B8B1